MDFLNHFVEMLESTFTIQNISFILGLIGSAGTAWSFINSRKRLIIQLSDIAYRTDIKTLVIVIVFENRSRLPISITDVTLIAEEKELSFEPYPRCVAKYSHKEGSEVVDRKFLYNLAFPVSLAQLEAASGHLLLDISQEEFEKLPTQVTLQVRSTRGRVQKKQLSSSDIRLTKSTSTQHHV